MRKPYDSNAIFKWLIIIHGPIWSLFWVGVVLFFYPLRLRLNVKKTSQGPRACMKYVYTTECVWNHTRRWVKGKRTSSAFSQCKFDLETGWACKWRWIRFLFSALSNFRSLKSARNEKADTTMIIIWLYENVATTIRCLSRC